MRILPSLLSRVLFLALLLVLGGLTPVAHAKVYYVKPTGKNTNSGLSWSDATATVQAAINSANSGDQVWVAAGTYSLQGTFITMKTGVSIYGGFKGTETARNQRNPTKNLTVLDGINQQNNVIYVPQYAVVGIDGFTVKNGSNGIYTDKYSSQSINNSIIVGNSNAGIQSLGVWLVVTGNTISQNGASGISSTSPSSVYISSNIITKNSNGNSGGGVFVNGGHCTLDSNSVIDNAAGSGYGGGIFIQNVSSTSITNNIIQGNSAGSGESGLSYYAPASTLTFSNNVVQGNVTNGSVGGTSITCRTLTFEGNQILGNSGGSSSGGLYCHATVLFTIANSLVSGNAGATGGIYINGTGTISNCTIVNNSAPANGAAGGVKIDNGGAVAFANNIVVANTSGIFSSNNMLTLVSNDVYGNIGYNYSGLQPGSGDLNLDPLFVDMLHDDYHLGTKSPLIDAGTDSYVNPGDTDLDGNPRIYGAHVDIGAYEWDSSATDLVSVMVAPSTILGGLNLTGTVTLTAVAPTGGVTVALSYNSTANGTVSGPINVTVPAGATSATFTITTSAVAQTTLASVSGFYRGITQTANFTLMPYLASLTLAMPSLLSGGTTTGNVNLNGPAPANGLTIALSSSDTTSAVVPRSILIAANATSSKFTITGETVISGKAVVLTAANGPQTLSTTLIVNPSGTADVKSIGLAPASVLGGQPTIGVVTITAKAPAGGLFVPLSSAMPYCASVPTYIAVPAGRSSVGFPVSTNVVSTITQVAVKASLESNKTATLTLTPNVVTSMTFLPSPAQVGDTVIGIVTLSSPAPAGGFTLLLSVDQPSLLSPDASVTIPAGQTTGTFYAEALGAGTVNVTANLNGVSTTVPLVITN